MRASTYVVEYPADKPPYVVIEMTPEDAHDLFRWMRGEFSYMSDRGTAERLKRALAEWQLSELRGRDRVTITP